MKELEKTIEDKKGDVKADKEVFEAQKRLEKLNRELSKHRDDTEMAKGAMEAL